MDIGLSNGRVRFTAFGGMRRGTRRAPRAYEGLSRMGTGPRGLAGPIQNLNFEFEISEISIKEKT